jgi:hypothetical protein
MAFVVLRRWQVGRVLKQGFIHNLPRRGHASRQKHALIWAFTAADERSSAESDDDDEDPRVWSLFVSFSSTDSSLCCFAMAAARWLLPLPLALRSPNALRWRRVTSAAGG